MKTFNDEPNIIHNINNNEEQGLPYTSFFIFLAVVIIFGVITGFFVNKMINNKSTGINNGNASNNTKTVGIADKKTFKDSAEGILAEGGIDGEGNFHLQRPGGESQNVYLTSAAVDLSQYVGKKVKVWGETFKGQKAGWLMDVGLVEILR